MKNLTDGDKAGLIIAGFILLMIAGLFLQGRKAGGSYENYLSEMGDQVICQDVGHNCY